jgi:hypothetical protein
VKCKNIVDLAHFRKKAEEWIAMEEAYAAKKDDLNAATQLTQTRKKEKSRGIERVYNNYTMLNAGRDRIFKEINNTDIIGPLLIA